MRARPGRGEGRRPDYQQPLEVPPSSRMVAGDSVRVTGSPAGRVISRSIHLGSKKVSGRLSGSPLTAGHRYTLSERITFRGGRRVAAKLKFRSCPN